MSDPLLSLILFALVGSITPGPNTVMVTASGAAFGFVRTIPHMLGIAFGVCALIVAFGLGLGEIFRASPQLHWWLRIVGAAYLLYLAWRIARSGDPGEMDQVRKPLSFFEAAIFQWVNPKALTLVLGVVTAFTTVGGSPWVELATICLVFAVAVNLSSAIWCLFGIAIRSFLKSPRALRITALIMATVLAASVIMLFV